MAELYLKYEYWVAALQLCFAMFGMGATLTIGDFKQVLQAPRAVCIGLIIQLMLVPLIAFAFISSTTLTAGVVIGVALIAAIPGGTTSNIFTYFARGNVPLSISITGLTTLICLVSTPLILSVLVSDQMPNGFSMPSQKIASDIAFTLLLPLFLGMLVLRFFAPNAGVISTWSIRLSLLGIFAIIIGAASAGRIDLQEFGVYNISMILLFITLLMLGSYLLTHLLKLTRSDKTAIGMEVVARNVNLAVLIKVSMFPANSVGSNTIGDQVLFAVLLYGVLQMLFSAGIITANRFKLLSQ